MLFCEPSRNVVSESKTIEKKRTERSEEDDNRTRNVEKTSRRVKCLLR